MVLILIGLYSRIFTTANFTLYTFPFLFLFSLFLVIGMKKHGMLQLKYILGKGVNITAVPL